MKHDREPHNPFYLLLLLFTLVFVVTALAYAIVPVLEEKARLAGSIPPPSPFRDSLREWGWLWLLIELGPMLLFAFASMGLDRLRRLQKEHSQTTMGRVKPPEISEPEA